MGTYERYEAPTESRSGMGIFWVVTAVALVGIAGAVLIYQRSEPVEVSESDVVTPTTPPVAGTEPSLPAEAGSDVSSQAKDARIAELEMLVRDKDFELSGQRAEIESLEARVSQLLEDSERYQAGLEQAVAELNQLRADIGRLQEAGGAPRVPTTAPPGEGVQPVGAPQVTISTMGAVLVTGFVNNPTRYAARGRIEISLVGSAGVIETRDFLMYIPPESQERYDITFPGIFPTERIAAQARWIE